MICFLTRPLADLNQILILYVLKSHLHDGAAQLGDAVLTHFVVDFSVEMQLTEAALHERAAAATRAASDALKSIRLSTE